MHAVDLLRRQVKRSWAWLEFTVSDVTPEQATWRPPGTANSVGATYAHLIICADIGFNRQLHRGMPIITRDFGGDVGLSEMNHGDAHEWASRVRIDWERLREYARQVHRCVEDYVDALTPGELAWRVDMTPYGLGVWDGLEVYELHGIGHVKMHGGEIACLKGIQGATGWGEMKEALSSRPGLTPGELTLERFSAHRDQSPADPLPAHVESVR